MSANTETTSRPRRPAAVLLVALLAGSFAVTCAAAARATPGPGARLWLRTFALPHIFEPTDAATAPGGSIYQTGGILTAPGQVDLFLVKLSPAGRRLWTRFYDGPAHLDDHGKAVGVDRYGNVFVAGTSTTAANADYLLIKYGPDGTRRWVRRYNGLGDGDDRVDDAVVPRGGGAYLTGTSAGAFGTQMNIVTVRYDRNGVRKWDSSYTGPFGDDEAVAIALDAHGDVLVTGDSPDAGGIKNSVTLKLDLRNGDLLWAPEAGRYSDPTGAYVYSRAVQAGPGNTVYALAEAQTGVVTGDDVVLIQYGPGGHRRWVTQYNGPLNLDDNPRSLAVDVFGNAFVAGDTETGAAIPEAALALRFDAAGTMRWQKRYKDVAGGRIAEFADVSVGPRGRVVFAGSVGEAATQDSLLASYTRGGALRWRTIYSAPAGARSGLYWSRPYGSAALYVLGVRISGPSNIRGLVAKYVP
jgi:hypothetical protein